MNNFFFFDVAALVVVLTVLIVSYYRHVFKGRTNNLSFLTLIIMFVTVSCKIIFSILFTLSTSPFAYNVGLVFVYFYLISYNLIQPCSLVFCCSDIGVWHFFNHRTVVRTIFISVCAFIIIYILLNPYSHHIFDIVVSDGELKVVYYQGKVVLFYAMISVMLFTQALFVIYRNYLDKERIVFGILLYAVNIVFLSVDKIFFSEQVSIFIFVMTCYMVSSTAQRPELFIDPIVKTASANSFFLDIKKNLMVKRHSDLIFIKIVNYKNLKLYLGQQNYDVFLGIIAEKLSSFSKKRKLSAQTYYLGNSSFVLSADQIAPHQLNICLEELRSWFHDVIYVDGLDVIANAMICIVRCPEDISTLDYLDYFSKNIHHIMPYSDKVMWLKDYTESKEFKIKNDLELILERAIDNNFFEVHYQPIYGIAEDRFVSVEALVRLNDPVYGYIPPSLFLKLAENTGDILKIGDFVMSKVVNFISADSFNQMNLDYVEMNLSVSQCSDPNLVEKILGRLEKNNISPKKLHLEITENAVDSNPEIVEKNVMTLHEAGIEFALDDYGIGYSNIKKAIALPLDVVKLDKVFVDELNDEKMQLVITDTIFMLKELKKTIFVEGIENVKAVEFFKNLKYKDKAACEYIQGYYYSKPLPERELVSFLRNSLL